MEGKSPNPRRKAWLNLQESAEAVVPGKACKARLVRHRQTKAAETDRPGLNATEQGRAEHQDREVKR